METCNIEFLKIEFNNDINLIEKSVKQLPGIRTEDDFEDTIPSVRLDKVLIVKEENKTDGLECKECGEQFLSHRALEIHMVDHITEPYFTCKNCRKLFDKKYLLRKHIAERVCVNPYRCNFCGINFKWYDSFIYHMRKGHLVEFICKELYTQTLQCNTAVETRKELSSCKICGDHFETGSRLNRHMMMHRKGRAFQCAKCGECFQLTKQMLAHMRTCTKNLLNKAEVKSEIEISETELFEWNFECSNEGTWNAEPSLAVKREITFENIDVPNSVCGNTDLKDSKCDVHNQTGSSQLYFQPLAQRDSANMSVAFHGNKRLSKCNVCGKNNVEEKVCSCTTYIHSHTEKVQTVNSKQKQYKCNICEKMFRSNSHLKDHIETHSGEKPYYCNLCHKFYKLRHSLHKHMQAHSKLFECSICRKVFSFSTSLKTHMKLHTAVKLFGCSTCGKQFTHKSTFIRHLKLHSGEKPYKKRYKCDVCNKYFVSRNNWKKHLFTHVFTKLHECYTCGKFFSEEKCLRKHLHIHTSKMSFKCHVCEESFTQEQDMTQHMKNSHQEKVSILKSLLDSTGN